MKRNPKGSGTVVQRDEKWYPRWTVQGSHVYGAGHDNFDDADRERIDKNPLKVRGKLVKKREIPSFHKWASKCLDGSYGDRIAASTHATNETILNRWIEKTELGSMRIDRISRLDIIEWIEILVGSPRTIRRIVAFAAKAMSLAVDAEYRRDSPFRSLGDYLPRVVERDNRILSLVEAKKLLALAPARRIDAMIMIALLTGLRRGEICGLQWGHIREGGTLLTVPGTKNASSKRVIPLAASAHSILTAQPKRGVWIFTTEDGNQMDAHNVSRDFRLRKEQLKLPAGTRFHDMRGTFATVLLEQGADVRSVMELTGHAKADTLLRMYARASQTGKTAMVKKLDLSLGKKSKAVNRGRKALNHSWGQA